MDDGYQGDDGKTVTLRRWTVVAVVTRRATRSRHVWGHDVASDEGFVSGAIVRFDMATMTATAVDGIRYRLGGLPGHSRMAQPVWDEWCRRHEVVGQLEVTNDYMDPDDVSTRQFMALNVSAFSGRMQ